MCPVRQDAEVETQYRPVDGPHAAGSGGRYGWRAKVRRTPGGALFLKIAVFLLGLLFILLGIMLAALPGPLTIPPILLGVWIWSSEFGWADRLLERAKRSAHEAWENAKRRPVVSALVTLSGLVAVGIAFYLVSRFELVDHLREVAGI
jgi:uncharacterized membrane protein YbaN (DUF454 family)